MSAAVCPTSAPALMQPLLLRRFGTPQWDMLVRATGIVALAAWYPCWRWPDVAGVAGFFCVTVLVNGPLSPFLPVAYEPMLMAAGRLYSPLLVALIGVTGTVYVEFLNYHLYRVTADQPRFARARNSRLVRTTVALFSRSPFFCVWLCALTPLPFWAVRLLAPLSGYPVRPYLTATFLGRLPRLFFFAAIGTLLPVATSVLVAYSVTAVVVGAGVAIHIHLRRRPARRD